MVMALLILAKIKMVMDLVMALIVKVLLGQ